MPIGSNVLQVENVVTRFNTQDGKVFAVNGISFDLKEGELLGVVGESGSGKSVTMMSLLKLLPMPPAEIVEGRALFENQDLIQMDLNQLRKIRGGKIGFILQDPMTSLNPVLSIGYQLMEPMREHLGLSKVEARKKAVELMELVGIPMARSRLKDFPHQFSGGMRQRVMIAIALACDPKVLIADEPTTALDVTIQAQILDIVKRLRKELGMAIIWITHDLGVVAGMADRVAVMYVGKIVELGNSEDIFDSPKHPYTSALLSSVPIPDPKLKAKRIILEGEVANPANPPSGCYFHPRCPYAQDICKTETPELIEKTPGHFTSCHLSQELQLVGID